MQMHGYGMHFSSHLSAELHHVYPGCRCRMRWPLGTRLVINGVEKELARNNHGVLQWEIYDP